MVADSTAAAATSTGRLASATVTSPGHAGARASPRPAGELGISHMTRVLGHTEGPTFGDPSISARFSALRQRGEQMEADFFSPSTTDFCVAAWHLFEWINRAPDASRLAKSKSHDRNWPSEMCHLRDTLRDLANGEKHFFLKPDAAAKKVVVRMEPGETRNWLAYFFHERGVPGVTTKEGYYFSARKLRDRTLEFFTWVFDDSVPVDQFPPALREGIWRCKIGNRSKPYRPPTADDASQE